MHDLKKVGILFDLDGTLLDTLDDLADSVNVTLKQFGCPERTRDEIRRFVGNGTRSLVKLSLPGKADDPNLQETWEFYQAYYETHCQIKTKPYPGIPEAISALGEKYPVAIVSNKPDPFVKALCQQHFPGIYARGERLDCPRKPEPDVIFQTMNSLGVDSCVYVGDSEVDIITAKNAGVPCLSVLWGFRDRDMLEEVGGTVFCEEPGKLTEMLEDMLK